ncbi:unnamed protein product [Darwinula stevensoni]|uniref:NadR/Ttd14 AAA domain-containing protein n=1 Tax=Darwinula stevensoni TaxID=69355 RepID=A0A7R8XB73_9CRUS|nr:unnamed protein product [Darwinula stevensoni]CAG0890965.1 unnamed protein product [Darwinula stevensoni]
MEKTQERKGEKPPGGISKHIYKIVLTGGPCGGKTTGQLRLSTFFENLGWKVFRVPETASILLSGGVKFSELTEDEGDCLVSSLSVYIYFLLSRSFLFQESLLKTMMQIEQSYFSLAESNSHNCLIICDRGAMDASAFISLEKWEKIMQRNRLNAVDLRDSRYNHIVHMVSAAYGAEQFYSIEDHSCRSEDLELARKMDNLAAKAWIGHPYFDVIDNCTDFESKMKRMIQTVCQRIGIDTSDRLAKNAKKRKFLVKAPLSPLEAFPPFQDFDVVHDYLSSAREQQQARLRKRGQKGHWNYTHTMRKPEMAGQVVEVRTQITHRDYLNLLTQRSPYHVSVYKRRRCFLWKNLYFQLDIYQEPCHPRCKKLMLLETYTQLDGEMLKEALPPFLDIEKEVTGDPHYSMYNLSLKEDWTNNSRYCKKLPDGIRITNGSLLKSQESDESVIITPSEAVKIKMTKQKDKREIPGIKTSGQHK